MNPQFAPARGVPSPDEVETVPQGILVDAGQAADPQRDTAARVPPAVATVAAREFDDVAGDGEFVHVAEPRMMQPRLWKLSRTELCRATECIRLHPPSRFPGMVVGGV